MAFDATRLTRIGHMCGVAGLSMYHYLTDGTDTVASCVASGYFNNVDDDVNLRVGDRIYITVPGTQTAQGTYGLKQIVDVGTVIVMSVNDTTGVVDCSADIEATTLTYT